MATVSVRADAVESGFESKPTLRGISHLAAFFVSIVVGAVLVAGAHDTRGTVAAAVFAVCTALMFGASALYHRVRWNPAQRRWMRRVDHAGVYLMIAGSYMPFLLIVLSGAWQAAMLAVVWTGVLAAIITRFAWVTAPGWLAATFGVAIGWVSLLLLPQALDHIGLGAVLLLVAGGVLYTAGGVFYACQWPKLAPRVFGYHELFHAFVIAAVVCQYAVVAFYVIPSS